MHPRFVGRLGLADAVTVSSAVLGFAAIVIATVDTELAARLILLAAIADGLDGVIARHRGGTPAGEYLDSLADAVSFCIAPAMMVFFVAQDGWAFSLTDPSTETVVAGLVVGLYVGMGIVRLGLYTAEDVGNDHTEGVQTTLAATILAAMALAGLNEPAVLLAGTAAFSYLMVTRVTYPDLYARDAVAMGAIQAAAVIAPRAVDAGFPRLLLVAALAYLVLAPRYYWRDVTSTAD